MELFKTLMNNVLVHENQGYALYFYHKGYVFEKTSGKQKENDSDDIKFDTNFRLASVSKQFIAFSIVNLIKSNMIDYETNIKTIFDELPDYFLNITVKHLLNHTSGIYDYEDMPHKENDPQIKDKDIIDFLKTTSKTYFIPGTNYKYSNTGYILLGLIVEKISSRPIDDYIENQVFKVAGMNDSKVNIEGKTKISNRAYGHLINDSNELYVKDQYWCSATIGDGGLYSSVKDLKKWCLFLANSNNFQDMRKPNYINEETYNEYGLGIRIINVCGNEVIYHCGDTIGTNTLLLFSKDLDLCLIFLTNLGGINTSIMKDNLIKYLSK